MRAYLNNEIVIDIPYFQAMQNIVDGNIILLNGFSYQKNDYIFPFDGSISDLHIWGKVLSQDEIMQFDICDEYNPGDIIDWNHAKFKIYGAIDQLDTEFNNICPKKGSSKLKYLSFHETLNFVDSVKFCDKIGGEIAVAEDLSSIQKMQRALGDVSSSSECPNLMYTGYWYQASKTVIM